MSEADFLKNLKAQLSKAIIYTAVSFIGMLIVTIFTVQDLTGKVSDLNVIKADRALVEMQFINISDQIDDLDNEIKVNQQRIIDLITKK